MALQALLWRHLVATHLGPSAGPLGDVFFALSAFHALHVLGGLVALAFAGARPLRLPPPPDAPPGYLTHITIDKVGGVGPWAA